MTDKEKIEKAIEECNKETASLNEIIDMNVAVGCVPDYARGSTWAYERIIEILEGAE